MTAPTPLPQAEAHGPGDRRLPLGTKLTYAAPSFAGAALFIPIGVYMPKFYSDVVLVPLSYIAVAIALARAFDAITDPLMGFLSDRTRTRWGRRRPWMAVGAPLCALAVVALFTPPRSLGPEAAAGWFAVSFLLYFLFHTVYLIPYLALGPELTLDYHERSSLFGWREGVTMAGLLTAVAAPGLLIDVLGASQRFTFAAISLCFGALLVIFYANLIARIRERPDFMTRSSNPIVPGVRRALRNRPFCILLLVYVVASIPGAIPATLMPYFTEYVIRPEQPQLWITIFLTAYVGSGIAFLPLWIRAARRFGKRPVWLASFWLGITGGPLIFTLGEGDVAPFLLLLVYVGSAFGAGMFLNPAIQADVMDYDELRTGKRREAQYSSFWAMAAKFVAIPSAALPLAILGMLGYVPNQPQTELVETAIRGLIGFAPALFSVLAFAVALRFPITERSHRQIQEGIVRHQRGEAAWDPVRQEWLAPPHARGLPEEQSWFLDHFSPGELQRALRHGPGTLLPRTVAMTTLSLVACLAAGGWGASLLVGASGEPDAWATAAVVGAGFALAAVGFHLLRVRAARIMRLRPMNLEIIRAHLRGHDLFVAPPNPGADDMSRIDRYAAYAQAFEKAFENDDWSLVEPYFSEDAVYESLEAPPLGYRSEGRSAILEGLKRSLDSLDRRFESRELQLLEGPEERDGSVWIRWRATYRSPSVPELVIEGEETAAFDGDRIRRLEDRFAPGTGERVLAFMEAHAARLAPEPS